jgi:hypothetical protein
MLGAGSGLLATLFGYNTLADHKPEHTKPGRRTPTTTPVPTNTVESTFTPVPTNTVESTFTPVPTNTAEPTFTPVPTNTVESTLTPEATFTPAPTETVEATSTATETATATPTIEGPLPPVPVDRVLVNHYVFRSTAGFSHYNGTMYLPRGFVSGAHIPDPSWDDWDVVDAGKYAGWDIHPTLNSGIERVQTNADWFTLTLNRPATIAVVWRAQGAPPQPIASWPKDGTVRISHPWGEGDFPVYRTTVSAGSVALPGVNHGVSSNPRDTYWVLLAEANGHPSAAPDPSILPNQTCPFHPADWHPEIDPVHWCYYRHEHGVDPAYFSALPPPVFGATAAAAGMAEGNVGFKVYVFDSVGVRWRILHHFGTAGYARICQRHHTVEVAAMDPGSGMLLCDLKFMADFGRVINSDSKLPYTPSACPDQDFGNFGERQIPALGGTAYEPWIFDASGNVLGIGSRFGINTFDHITACVDTTVCDSVVVVNGHSGTERAWSGTEFLVHDPGHSADGVFWTDPMGMHLMDAGAPGAIRQFVAPGLSIGPGIPNSCVDVNRWHSPYVCGLNRVGPSERENSIPNGGPN